MTNLIEPNKRLFNAYCILAKIFGWSLVGLGTLWLSIKSFALLTRLGDFQDFVRFLQHEMPWGLVSYLPTGIIVLGIGQFLRYLIDKDYSAGWLLRHSFTLINIYAFALALLLAIECTLSCIHTASLGGSGLIMELMIRIASAVFFGGGQVLIMVGIALFIKNVLPVIEESRTLV